jgi:hypothetical protein
MRANRPRLVQALHVLVAHWLARGQPGPDDDTVPAFGSYELYRKTVGGILGAAGVTDFLGNRDATRAEADPQSERWQAFVTAWWTQFSDRPVSPKELLSLAIESDVMVAGHDEAAKVLSLGSQLGHRRHRVFAGYKVLREAGLRKWRLEQQPESLPF